MDHKLSMLGPFLALCLFLSCVSSDSVPALVWSNQAHLPDAESRYSTLVDQIEPNELLGDYVTNKVRVVALVQKDLNVEQFAANDASYVSTIFNNAQAHPQFFANVKNPRKVFTLFKNDDQTTNDNVVIYLSGNSLKENDETIKAYSEKFNATGPVVFMLTGENNELLKVNKRARRDTAKESTNALVFLTLLGTNDIPCLLVTASGATANLYKKDQLEVKNFFNPAINKLVSKCSEDRAPSLTMTFDKLTVTWEFTFNAADATATQWDLKPTTVKIDSQTYTIGKNVQVSNTKGFSYSCQKASIPVTSTGEYDTGTIIIDGFQVQPYYNKDSPKDGPVRFDDSSDCSVWFTLPIFSGLIVVLILITILYFGVIALMSISTPDRFENPKGKTLIITNFDE